MSTINASTCCNAPAVLEGEERGTRFFRCLECNKACDARLVEVKSAKEQGNAVSAE